MVVQRPCAAGAHAGREAKGPGGQTGETIHDEEVGQTCGEFGGYGRPDTTREGTIVVITGHLRTVLAVGFTKVEKGIIIGSPGTEAVNPTLFGGDLKYGFRRGRARKGAAYGGKGQPRRPQDIAPFDDRPDAIGGGRLT